MVFVYLGKNDFAPYAVNTIFKAVVPTEIKDGQPCLLYWQWAKDAAGATNVNRPFSGKFEERQTNFYECREPKHGEQAYYWFTWDTSTNVIQMLNEKDDKVGKPIHLTLTHE